MLLAYRTARVDDRNALLNVKERGSNLARYFDDLHEIHEMKRLFQSHELVADVL